MILVNISLQVCSTLLSTYVFVPSMIEPITDKEKKQIDYMI